MLLVLTPEDVLLAYGPLGVLALVALLLGRRLIMENDSLRRDNRELIERMFEVVPLLKRSAEIHEKRHTADEISHNEIRANRVEITAMKAEVQELRRALEARR